MKKLLSACLLTTALLLTACGDAATPSATNTPEEVIARAFYQLDRVYVDGHVTNTPSAYANSSLTFIGEEQGGIVLIQVGDYLVQAGINPSREHPSFETGEWHHHLYAGNTASGSNRINFYDTMPTLGIDTNLEATDPTQSAFQRGNLHYLVDSNQYRLRFTIDGVFHDLIFS